MRQPDRLGSPLTHAQYIVMKLGYLREARGLSVAELARRARMDRSQLGKVLRGERGLRADEFICLCYALGVRAEQFLPDGMKRELADLNMRTPDGRLKV